MGLIEKIKKISSKYPKWYIWFVLQKNPFRVITSPLRGSPDFIVFGVPKAGTTALDRYLRQHPEICMASRKEVHFFNKDLHYSQGLFWYSSFFPIRGSKCTSGEVTPDYMYHPDVPKRILKDFPKTKLIAILRNPTDRAYSHYQYIKRTGRESLTFEEAIDAEPSRINEEKKKNVFDGDNIRKYSYLDRGIYVDQLKHWMKFFPKEQFLIIKNEELDEDINGTMNKIFRFLNVSPKIITDKKRYFVGEYSPMKIETRRKLIEFYKEHNKRLSEFLGIDLDWDK